MSPSSNDSTTRTTAWVISGTATDEEIAAVTTVITAMAHPGAKDTSTPTASGWAAHWRRMNTGTVPAHRPRTGVIWAPRSTTTAWSR